MSDWRLSIAETKAIIGMYRQSECLWNYKSSLYKRTDLKKKAWGNISQQFDKSVADCKKKLKHLRSAYVAEKKKVEDSLKTGTGIEEIYVPHLFYFEEFSFLDGVIVLRKTQSYFSLGNTLERGVEACEESNSEEPSGMYQTFELPFPTRISAAMPERERRSLRRRFVSSASSRCTRYEKAIAAILKKQSNSQEEPKSKYAYFGSSVASQLEDLTPIEAAAAMAELQQVLSKHVVNFHSRSSTPQSSSLSSSGGNVNDSIRSAMMNWVYLVQNPEKKEICNGR